ncbi:hypothetical protein BH10PSE7_BH10PSE7_40560 [soil metagenome]
MRIGSVFKAALLGLPLAALSACGDSSKDFTTRGLVAPSSICTVDPRVLGDARRLSEIDEGNGCEVPKPFEMRSIANVQFSQPAIVNCGMAEPLNDWMTHRVQPAAQTTFGESVVSVDIAASYSCRARNSKRGARMSEHGFGNAIDIAAFTLESGRKVTVEDGWRDSSGERNFLREVRSDACGDFHTVLGPGDAHHDDHFHLDLANRPSGKLYCK